MTGPAGRTADVSRPGHGRMLRARAHMLALQRDGPGLCRRREMHTARCSVNHAYRNIAAIRDGNQFTSSRDVP